jgi:hypothetical protein
VQIITIDDITPPTITPGSGNAYCLWPPNHRYVCFSGSDFEPLVSDNCDSGAIWRVIGCVSNQPDDGTGDGDTRRDCVVSPDGARFCVRSERDGSDPDGRTYTVTILATDACGITAEASIGTVHVPHEQSAHPGGCRNAAREGRAELPWIGR